MRSEVRHATRKPLAWPRAIYGRAEKKGLLIRRALDLMSALRLAVHIGLDDIRGDEFCAMLIIAEERDLQEREKLPGHHGRQQ